MKEMAKGDKAFFYHSVNEKQIVGIVKIVKEHEPDPSDKTGKGFGMMSVQAVESVKTPVTLADIKAEPKLAEMILVKNSRLSVQPVKAAEWKAVCKMAGVKP